MKFFFIFDLPDKYPGDPSTNPIPRTDQAAALQLQMQLFMWCGPRKYCWYFHWASICLRKELSVLQSCDNKFGRDLKVRSKCPGSEEVSGVWPGNSQQIMSITVSPSSTRYRAMTQLYLEFPCLSQLQQKLPPDLCQHRDCSPPPASSPSHCIGMLELEFRWGDFISVWSTTHPLVTSDYLTEDHSPDSTLPISEKHQRHYNFFLRIAILAISTDPQLMTESEI